MVDCRPAAGAAPHDIAHSAPNGAAPENHHNQPSGNNEMGGHGVAAPASVRASTPASNALATYTGNVYGGMNPTNVGYPAMAPAGGGGAAPYVCGVKSVVWCASPPPPPHAPPPPPHGVNPHVFKSVQANGADLPMNDIPTLRYYFNLGVECMWAAYGPPPPHPPPRHYSPRDLAQDMQQMGLHERPMGDGHKHKPQDAKPQGKPAQRPLLGPRFKRSNNQDGSQNSNHSKGHNHNMGNKGPNNRRNSQPDARGGGGVNVGVGGGGGGSVGGGGGGSVGNNYGEECVMEPPMLTLPYMTYPPPIYPIPYYPVDADPGMMGMMGGMGYVGYEDGGEYAPMPYYPHYPPPHALAHPMHHPQHPQHPQHPHQHHAPVEHK